MLFVLLATIVSSVAFAQDIDFRKEIIPILEEHCFECHGNGNLEGNLSLDSVASMQIGGHSGSPILSSKLSDSELYLRITSLSDGYRMPKKGDPLPQKDIDKIAKWMTEVAGQLENRNKPAVAIPNLSGDQDTSAATPETFHSSPASSASTQPTNSSSEGLPQSQVLSLVVATVVICLLLCWLFYRLAASQSSSRSITSGTEKAAALLAMAIGAASGLLLIGFGFFYWRCGQLLEQNNVLRSQIEVLKPRMAPVVEVGPGKQPMPPHPLHPPRLGGQYYRGNDERDDSLYNRGFYRTATIDLYLINEQGNRLKWGDEVRDGMSVEIRIQRAPKATRELFSSRVHSQTSIEHYCQSSPEVQQKLTFDVVEEEDVWLAHIPLPMKAAASSQHSKGMIYLMYGVQPGEKSLPRPHFAIHYNVQCEEGKITSESVLWMGSMYTLNNRVLVPEETEILLDRWFDWRPIPVIEGDGATESSLLGIDEHLKK